MRFETMLEPGQAENGLVDGVDFEIGREACEDAHHPRAHIAIERVIAGSHDHALAAELLLIEMPGRAHGNAERFCLVAARDHAAVVVRENHDRLAPEIRLKETLARCVEIIAIHQCERSGHG
jgi:hypothetical protein